MSVQTEWLSWGLARLAQGLAGARPEPSRGLHGWALANRRLRGEMPFTLTDYPYLEELYADPATEAVIMKAGQVGVTEYGINRALWTTCEVGGSVLFVLPVWSPDASDFSQARLKAAIEDSPDILAQAAGIDNVGLKRVGLGLIYCRGSERRHSLKEMAVDLVVVEELDECNQANLPFAFRRLDHSTLRHRLLISNPTLPGYGIHALWEESDQREWTVPCPSCGRRQPLVFERNLEPPAQDRAAFWACEKCRAPLDRLRGEWVAGQPSRALRAYHITQALSPRVTAGELWADWQDAEGDVFKEAAHFNLRRGEPYAAKGQKVELGSLLGLKEGYPLPPLGKACSMGVDVGTVLHVRISERAEGGRKRAVYIGTVPEFDDLDPLMKAYDVACAVVDALPETRKAREFVSRFKRRAFMAYYATDPKAAPEEWDEGERVVNLARTSACDSVMSRISGGGLLLPDNVAALLPRDARAGHSHYLVHMTTPVRVRRLNSRGQEVAEWTSSGKPDHFFHAEVYDEAAFRHLLGKGTPAGQSWQAVAQAHEDLRRRSPWRSPGEE